jgi:ATP adenylyltransferase
VDYLWSPWRFRYVSQSEPSVGCIFCTKPSELRDEQNLILFRGERNFVLLNLYPYTSGHLMIAPYAHVPTLSDAPVETVEEMMRLARAAESRLRAVYQPKGFNVGLNLGECAGAGVAGHIHLHVVPRWPGDANFMTTVAETRVVPESIEETYRKLRAAFSL